MLCLWPAALCAQVKTDDHDGGSNTFALLFYTSTTTTGLGSTALTAIGLVSSLNAGDQKLDVDKRKAALRAYLRDAHHDVDAGLALGAGAAIEELGALVGWPADELATRGRALRAARAQLAGLARRAVEEDEALDALFVLLWRG